jgi:hypothetical protein
MKEILYPNQEETRTMLPKDINIQSDVTSDEVAYIAMVEESETDTLILDVNPSEAENEQVLSEDELAAVDGAGAPGGGFSRFTKSEFGKNTIAGVVGLGVGAVTYAGINAYQNWNNSSNSSGNSSGNPFGHHHP